MNDIAQFEGALTSVTAASLDAAIRQQNAQMMFAVYVMNRGQGYRMLEQSFETFESYVDSLGFSIRTVYSWISRIDATLDVRGLTVQELSTSDSRLLLPARTAVELNRLPDAVAKRGVFEKLNTLIEIGCRPETEYGPQLKLLVNQVLNPVSETEQSAKHDAHSEPPGAKKGKPAKERSEVKDAARSVVLGGGDGIVTQLAQTEEPSPAVADDPPMPEPAHYASLKPSVIRADDVEYRDQAIRVRVSIDGSMRSIVIFEFEHPEVFSAIRADRL